MSIGLAVQEVFANKQTFLWVKKATEENSYSYISEIYSWYDDLHLQNDICKVDTRCNERVSGKKRENLSLKELLRVLGPLTKVVCAALSRETKGGSPSMGSQTRSQSHAGG